MVEVQSILAAELSAEYISNRVVGEEASCIPPCRPGRGEGGRGGWAPGGGGVGMGVGRDSSLSMGARTTACRSKLICRGVCDNVDKVM